MFFCHQNKHGRRLWRHSGMFNRQNETFRIFGPNYREFFRIIASFSIVKNGFLLLVAIENQRGIIFFIFDNLAFNCYHILFWLLTWHFRDTRTIMTNRPTRLVYTVPQRNKHTYIDSLPRGQPPEEKMSRYSQILGILWTYS